jgi:hypothetical protein
LDSRKKPQKNILIYFSVAAGGDTIGLPSGLGAGREDWASDKSLRGADK